MLIPFFYMLRDGGMKTSITELLTLHEAMKCGLAGYSVDDFYFLSHKIFFHFKIDRKARDFADVLCDRDIFIRTLSHKGTEWIRASIGTPEEIQKFVEVLSETA